MKRLIQSIKDATRLTGIMTELYMIFKSDKPKIKVELTEDQLDILKYCARLGLNSKEDLIKACKFKQLCQ